MYRHIVFLCSIAIAVLSALSAARAADSQRCEELGRRLEITKSQITAIEVSLTLFSAVDGNCIALATDLLDSGASVDARDRFGARPLSHAARFGHLAMVDVLVARGAPLNARNLAGATALFFAVEGDHTPVAQLLIERGADVNLAGRSNVTPVSAASYRGNDVIVESLLARGADDRAPDQTGKTPLVVLKRLTEEKHPPLAELNPGREFDLLGEPADNFTKGPNLILGKAASDQQVCCMPQGSLATGR